jgi:hypothetical protein
VIRDWLDGWRLSALAPSRRIVAARQTSDRIGWPTSTHTVETQAALDAQYTIERELRASKTSADDAARELGCGGGPESPVTPGA